MKVEWNKSVKMEIQAVSHGKQLEVEWGLKCIFTPHKGSEVVGWNVTIPIELALKLLVKFVKAINQNDRAPSRYCQDKLDSLSGAPTGYPNIIPQHGAIF